MKNLIKKISVLSVSSYLFASSASISFAANTWGHPNAPKGVPTNIETAIMSITNYILGFVVIIATLVVIWGGVQYMTASGNDDAIANGKKTISYGLIGVVISGLAYAMVYVVSNVILKG